MSTTNVQLQITGRQQQATCADEEQHGRTKADQHHQQQQHCSRRRGGGGTATAAVSRSLVENSSQGRRCARCGGAFGRFYNTGASCPRCRHRVCRQCREFRGSATANNKGDHGVDWLCAVCHKIAELHAATGEWIYETATVTSDRLLAVKKNSPVDIIKRSIRRAWTINGPPARWSVARKSPAFRIYRSLPIRDKIYPSTDEVDIEDESFSLSQTIETLANKDDGNLLVIHSKIVEKIAEGDKCKGNDVAEDDCREQTVSCNNEVSGDSRETGNLTRNERTENERKLQHHIEAVTSSEQSRTIKNERETTIDDVTETITPRVSLIKPPRIIAKLGTPELKQGTKHGDRKSNIPIFRRSSKEFEDIGSPQESVKRSLIPQRYRGSTDDLRRSREDISVPSLIPKLFSPRNREQEKLKRQDSKDDVRLQLPKGNRRESKDTSKEETRAGSLTSSIVREEQKSGIRIFRRDSREDVGRETTSLPSLLVSRAKQTGKDEKHDQTEGARVGETVSRSKSCPSEQGKTGSKALSREAREFVIETKIVQSKSVRNENRRPNQSSNEHEIIVESEKMANEKTMIEERLDSPNAKTVSSCEETSKIADKDTEEKDKEEATLTSTVSGTEHLVASIEPIDPIIKSNEISVEAANCNETDFAGAIVGERKVPADSVYLKKVDDMQVVRRKFSKEEFSNPDDTDETPNRRSSSHLSPEASPLSTRSSRYSPRESESEPTPAFPRKIGSGDSCTASQRIRDAITRTRRESNSSARYESSGSESVRLSESGLHGYADLARRVKFFGSGGNSPGPSPGSDEPVQRDSATSAGEDEPHEDCHSRGPGSSQGRTMLRRRRQFDAQGSRRRGRSHARSCCGDELQNFQALHVIGRGGGRQPSSPQNQETPNPDYRRLVFISSDSSSGREEDDADSSCSGSSYLNGLPRNNHAQGLEDCDWDYFESGTLPLPAGVADATINVGHVGVDHGLPQDWSCCPGRGSAACLACGGSPGANVLPVPVPIPVPVPYPVPVPASLWTGDFAAAASSMITRGATPEGTLRLRGDPSAPWFSWHPRFNQPLHGARIDPRSTIGAFDPTSFGFRPEEISPRFYGSPAVVQESLDSSSSVVPPTEPAVPTVDPTVHLDDTKDANSMSTKSVEPKEPRDSETMSAAIVEASNKDSPTPKPDIVPEVEESPANEDEENAEPTADENNSEAESSNEDTEDSSQESSSSRENGRMYRHSRENSGSSSGRSSADSSDLEDSASHRFARVFVVNDDSLTSDNDIEYNEDSDSAREGGGVVTLKRVTSVPEEEPVVLRRVRLLDEDTNLLRVPGDLENQGERSVDRRPNRIERRIDLLAERDPDANEIYLASSTDCSDGHIQLKSIKNLNPDSIEMSGYREANENGNSRDLDDEPKNWDSVITPDSLEVVGTSYLSNSIEASSERNVTNSDNEADGSNSRDIEIDLSPAIKIDNNPATREDKQALLSMSVNSASANVAACPEINDSVAESTTRKCRVPANSSSCSTTDSSETNTTGSEVSSDELHEYEVSPYANGIPMEASTPRDDKKITNLASTKHQVTPMPRRSLRLGDQSSEILVSTPRKDAAQLPCVPPRNLQPLGTRNDPVDESNDEDKSIETRNSSSDNVDEIISCRIHDIFKKVGRVENAIEDDDDCDYDGSSRGTAESASSRTGDDNGAVRGEKPGVSQVGVSEVVVGSGSGGSDGETCERGTATARFRSVERRPPTRKENGCFPPTASSKKQASESQNFPSNNKYRSLVMITQGAYQPVSVITSDTTTLLQPPDESQSPQGLAGYFHLALEAVSEPHQRNGQGPRRPLMVKRLASASTEQEADSGLSVGGSASESDDVQSVKGFTKISGQQQQQQQQPGDQRSVPKTSAERSVLSNNNNNNIEQQQQQVSRGRVANSSPQSSDDNSVGSGVVILEEGLADDDSWVEEVSHDEDEQSATTATEESSEDEANNLGDREEELRGYHRQAIDFTLHTIVEESCEESEAEPSLAAGSPRKKRPPSASELEKYFFFGLGGDNSGASMGSREVDSLSETSSIYSEGLESLGQEEASPTAGQDNNKGSNEFLNSSRLEKYFLSEFLGFDQDRRDSDGSVGSDSEGRPSPEAQRRKRLVRARGTGRSSHSSSLDNLLALAQGSQNLSSQNSLQDLSLNQDSQETQSEGSSTETDGAEDGQTPAFGTDGQFDTVKRKKKKPRTLGTQSPRVAEDRSKTPEPRDAMVSEVPENEGETMNSEDDRAKTPQPESALHSSSSSSSQVDGARGSQASSSDTGSSRSKQQSRDSGFVGSCDDLLQHQKSSGDGQSHEGNFDPGKDHSRSDRSRGIHGIDAEKRRGGKSEMVQGQGNLQPPPNASLSRKDSFNNWSSDEETNLMMSKMRQFFKTMVANSNGQAPASNSSGPSPAPSPRLSGYSKTRLCAQNRTKPPQLVYFENELTRLMKTVPGIRDEQVREIVEYLSSEDTWSDSYDSSDYTSSDLEGAAGGRRSALQEQISQSCQQIISKFDTNSGGASTPEKGGEEKAPTTPQPCLGRDTAFVYQKLVQSFTKIAGDGPSSDANSTPHSSPPLIAKVMHHIGSRLVALMHEVSEGGSTVQPHSTWRRYSQHHRTPSSASTTEDDDSTSDSTNAPSSSHLPRSKSHDPLLLINGHPATTSGQEGEEREASDYERFSWRGSFESALMAADSRTKLSLLACSGDVSASASASALAMAAKRRSAGDLLFNPKSFSREQLDRVRSCGSIGGGSGGGGGGGVSGAGGSIEDKIWSNRRRSSVPDANTRGESGASAGDEDTEDELEYGGDPRATTLPRGMQAAASASAATNSLPRLPASTAPGVGAAVTSTTPMHKAHSVYHFLPQHTGVKSARYRPPGFARNSLGNAGGTGGPKRAVSAPGLQVSGSQVQSGKRETSRSRRQQAISLTPDDGSSLSEACSTPIIGAGSRAGSKHAVMDIDDMDRGLHSGHLATRASLSSLGARSDSMASVYSGAGEGRWCGSVAVRGEVEFSLQYDYKQLTFEVHVTQCKDLAPVDIKRNRSDPYVKVYLLPDKSKSGKRKTKVKKHTLNPVFDETLKFHMSLNGLETRTLWLTVWHSDMFGRNDFLGEVRMPLENKIFDDPTPRWYPLQERTEPFDDPISYKGEVIVGLKFVPPDPAQLERERETSIEQRGISKGRKNWSRGSLHVLVKEARNLQTRAKNSGTCDPFCKSYLLPDKGRSGKQKTGVVRRSGGSPVWGHTFVYKDVSLQELAERGLELTVWDHDRIASNEFLGGVRFNLGTGKHYGKVVDWMDATGRELSLWQSMLERPNFWVEGAVTLRPNLHNHGKSGGA